MNTFLCAGLAGALLASTACGGDLDAGSDGSAEAFLDQGSDSVDAYDSAEGLEAEDVIEKAVFPNNPTFNGFNVSCDTSRKSTITRADTEARRILGIALPANATARVNRNTVKGRLFRDIFVPGGNLNPNPNRPSPDAWDIASSRVGQKLAKVSSVLASAEHTCSANNESFRQLSNGTFQTCGQIQASAATSFAGGPVRWCDTGLNEMFGIGPVALTLLHELTHQDRTADAQGTRVVDPGSNPPSDPLANVENYVRWYINNQQ
jgi:hypothetical protein